MKHPSPSRALLGRRRFLAATGATAVTTLFAAACSSGDSAADDSTVSLMFPAGNPGGTAPLDAVLTPEFAQRSGIKVNVLGVAGKYDQVDQQIQATRVAGNAPDVAVVGHNTVPTYAGNGVAQPLDQLIAGDPGSPVGQLYPSFTQLGRIGGHTYALPYAATVPILYYNGDLFRKAGLNPDTPPKTFSEMRAAADKLVRAGGAKTGAVWPTDTSMWQLQQWVFSAGGTLMNPQQTAFTFTGSPTTDIVDYWAGLHRDGLGTIQPTQQLTQGFFGGDIGMVIVSASSLKSFEDGVHFELRTAVPPIPDNGTLRTPIAGGALIMLAQDPARQAAAWKVISRLIDVDSCTAVTKATGYVPVNKTAATGPLAGFIAQDPRRRAADAQVDSGVTWYQFPGDHAVQITDLFGSAVTAAITGKQPTAEALTAAARQAQPLLPTRR